MKLLAINCNCGAQKTFRGKDVDEVIAAIEAAGWVEAPEEGEKGSVSGWCRECFERMEDSERGEPE